MGGSLAPVQVAGFTWNGWQPSAVYAHKQLPRVSAVKIARKLQEKVGDLPPSDLSIRRFMRTLQEEVAVNRMGYYESILDDGPGVQCQVAPGELRGVLIGGDKLIVHFVVLGTRNSRDYLQVDKTRIQVVQLIGSTSR